MLTTSLPLYAATIQDVQGEAFVHAAGTAEGAWTPAANGVEVKTGDSVQTKNGSCTLVYGEQGQFAVDPQTTFEIKDTEKTQDVVLAMGKLRGKVNHEKVLKPFQVVTPAAVAAIRGTEIDVAYNADGQLVVDLHNGKIQVLNEDANLAFDLAGKKKIQIKYLKDANKLSIRNDCDSDGPITFNLLGVDYTAGPCDEKEVDFSTAADAPTVPTTLNNSESENPDEGRDPISPTT